jgi:hypothetical protein
MTYGDDSAEVKDLADALRRLELSEAGNPTHDETLILREDVINASVALQRKQDGPSGDEELVWARIPWTESGPLPRPGLEMLRATIQNGRRTFRKDVVVGVRPEPERGWVRVKLRSVEMAVERRKNQRVGPARLRGEPGR